MTFNPSKNPNFRRKSLKTLELELEDFSVHAIEHNGEKSVECRVSRPGTEPDGSDTVTIIRILSANEAANLCALLIEAGYETPKFNVRGHD